MLELKKVNKTYNVGGVNHKVLKDITISFRKSEFAAILGPSGSGKTTLLNIIGGLDKYNSGDIRINEVSTKHFRDADWDSYRNHRIGFVFQSYNLIPHQTVLSNVKLALTLSGISKREATKRAKKALIEVGLGDHIDKKPNQLSGGQMQRVAIARALVNNPDILLADEPTGALDSETSVAIMKILKEISKEKLVIMVTHNPELADEYATRIINLKDGMITSDSNPYNGEIDTRISAAENRKKQKRTKMSFFTALSLSLKNLLTKKGRTVLVSFAGSIGIIGIALILAVSTGMQNYIDDIQANTLTSYPLTIQRESEDITGSILAAAMSNEAIDDGKVHENQVLTSAIGSVTSNNLKDFRQYVKTHYSEVSDDITLMEDQYSVDPLIYTIDATGELAKLNPSDLFTSLMGGSTVVNAYSSMTSVYQQYDKSRMTTDLEVLAGRLPENYDEVIIILSEKGKIGDLLTYSLGLHDTDELSAAIAQIMSGKAITIDNEPLILEYEDLLNLDLRLLYATDTYKYNAKYNVYEDMSDDEKFMMDLYKKADKLKIVGITTPKDDMSLSLSGVAYLPELVTHIIEKSGESEIVKKQLRHPDLDIFSNKKFGENKNSFGFEFEDFVSVDRDKLSKAFGVNIDQNAISKKTKEYVEEISNDITADISPIEDELNKKLNKLVEDFTEELGKKMMAGEFEIEKFEDYVDEFIEAQDFSKLEKKYLIPADKFASMYAGLIKLKIGVNLQLPGMPEDAETMIDTTIKTLAINITEIIMKTEILTKVGNLTAYLSSSFANAFSVDQSAILGAFKLNFTEDELARVVSAMFNKTESSFSSNLAVLGYQELDESTSVSFYFNSFDGKTKFMEFIDKYNDKVREYGDEDDVIQYSDVTGALMNSVKIIVDAVSYVLIAFVSISLVVSSIMIGIITYISVYERTKEIGILRAIGASKHNISSIFNAETFIVGLLAGLFGIGITYLIIPIINLILRHFAGDVPLAAALSPKSAVVLIILSIILTLIGGIIPARAAAKKDPVEALRSE